MCAEASSLVDGTLVKAIARAHRRELTRAGLNAARARGRKGGCPPALTAKDLKQARASRRPRHRHGRRGSTPEVRHVNALSTSALRSGAAHASMVSSTD
jgi:hypothetical protein